MVTNVVTINVTKLKELYLHGASIGNVYQMQPLSSNSYC